MNEKVTLIPARRKTARNADKADNKIKVAAYCRVSTDSDEQAGSYEIQVDHYTDYINRNPCWELAGIYADDGISGTNTRNREGFNRMIEDCMNGRIDMVITKSISRFARNTIDCLNYVRKLKDKNIAIIFEKENINTLEASGELLLTIMASLAQQESASLSQNVKMGLQFRYQEGKVQINHNHFLGYTKDEDGNLVIVDNEAKIIKRIFREFLEGKSYRNIADGLERDNIATGSGGRKWHISTVRGILRNEKYMGDALLQKTVTTDFINKTRIRNDGSAPQYYVKDSHQPIIPRDLFLLAQEELLRRSNLKSGKNSDKNRAYSSRYALSGICICGTCGDIYRRIKWNNRGKRSVVWRCCNRLENGPTGCNATTIPEDELQTAVVKALNQLVKFSDNDFRKLTDGIRSSVTDTNEEKIKELSTRIKEKQLLLIKLSNENKDYEFLADEIEELRNEKLKLQTDDAYKKSIKNKLEQLENNIMNSRNYISEYDEELVRKYIKSITIHKDKYIIQFKADFDIVIPR